MYLHKLLKKIHIFLVGYTMQALLVDNNIDYSARKCILY